MPILCTVDRFSPLTRNRQAPLAKQPRQHGQGRGQQQEHDEIRSDRQGPAPSFSRNHEQGAEAEGEGPEPQERAKLGAWHEGWEGRVVDRSQVGQPYGMSILDTINPSLTRYRRDEPAPVLPLRDEPDLLSLLEASGRLVADEETASTDVSTVEEEELSALMGEKEEYSPADEQAEEDWED
jgi:hypothetical protein